MPYYVNSSHILIMIKYISWSEFFIHSGRLHKLHIMSEDQLLHLIILKNGKTHDL